MSMGIVNKMKQFFIVRQGFLEQAIDFLYAVRYNI